VLTGLHCIGCALSANPSTAMSRRPPPPSGSPTALPELLLLGCEGSGKSCLTRQCKWQEGDEDVSLAAAPTNGIERDEITHKQCRFVIKEIGGSMKPTWGSYFSTCSAVMFVFDVSNPFQFADATFELAQLLQNASLRTKPLVLVLNKTDAPGALSRAELEHSLQLEALLHSARGGSMVPAADDGSVSVVECSAAKAWGIDAVLDAAVRALQHAGKQT